MKNLKTGIFAATLLSAIALMQPAQLQATSPTMNQRRALEFARFAAGCPLAVPHNAQLQPMAKDQDKPNRSRNRNNIFELARDKMYTHITVKKGEEFAIAATRTGMIEANYFTPYISKKSFKTLPGTRLEDKDVFRFTALKKGHYTLDIETHVRFVKDKPCARITYFIVVHVEDDAAKKATHIAPKNRLAQTNNSCPIEMDGKKLFSLNPNQPRDFYIPLNVKQEFTVTAHKKADTLKYVLTYENLAPNRVENLADKDVFHFTAPAEYNGRLRLYLEEHKQDGSIEKEYRIIVANL